MNNLFRTFLTVSLLVASLFMASCEIDEADYVPSPELGAYIEGDTNNTNTISVEYTGALKECGVSASQPYVAKVAKGADWVRIGESKDDTAHSLLSLNGDGTIFTAIDRNDGVRRMALITLEAENRIDTVFVKQKGRKSSTLEVSKRSMLADYQGGQLSTLLKSSIEFDELQIDIYGKDIFDKVNWISNVTCVNNTLKFDVEPNPDPKNLRKATIRFSYTDDWNETIMTDIVVTQDKEVSITENILSFAEMRQKGERDITEDICIEGYIISDSKSGNAAPNAPITTQRIDYTGTQRIVYIESLDGRYGFMVEFKSVEDNVLNRYDKVCLNLNGCFFGMEGSANVAENDPVRYYINEVTANHILSIESGSSATIPHKELYFSELSDDDIYTYVSLKDCEFPIKKGPLTPLNEGYTGGGVATRFTANRISFYPQLVRDARGNDFYTLTNTTCNYRRTGKQLPYGSGTLSGVIVHEACDRFEWDSDKEAELVAKGYSTDQIYNLGNIGRYQIRHQSQEDIAFTAAKNGALTKVICEFAYFNNSRSDCAVNVDQYNKMYYPRYSSANTHTATLSHSSGKMGAINSWYYLGDSNCNDAVGSGVTDADGRKVDGHQIYYEANNGSGDRGVIETKYGSAWASSTWLNGLGYHYWVAEFSTADAVGSAPSVQFAVLNIAIGAPRYWNVEWSTNGTQWIKAGEYTVPDVTQWNDTRYWQLCGFKHVSCELPNEVLGQSKVYVRLIPNSALAGETTTYDKGAAADKQSALAYFAVRYTAQ